MCSALQALPRPDLGIFEAMNSNELKKLLEDVFEREITPQDAMALVEEKVFSNIGHSRLDLTRELRTGVPEVVFAGGKTAEHLEDVVSHILEKTGSVLITRLDSLQQARLQKRFPELTFFARSGVAFKKPAVRELALGRIAVISAGTSDELVAEEASACAEYFNLEVTRINDVGVAGLHRLLVVVDDLRSQDLLIVVAGMEGALPSVVSGLTPTPLIAVPTSVGYGAVFSGLAALLAMLVSCSPGVTVVNIDNGFGAAVAAAKLLRHLRRREIVE